MTGLAPVPSENATCSNCGAALVSDQRYCLSCGQPCSPVRLAFLDVLETERQPGAPGAVTPLAGPGYGPYAEPPLGGPPWLRRAAPLLAVLSVLLLALIVGLLVGHWVTQSKAPNNPGVIKIEGLGGLASTGGTSTPATTSTTSSSNAASEKSVEAAEQKEAEEEEKQEEKEGAKAQPAKKVSGAELKKKEKATGKKAEEAVKNVTTAPIEVP